MRRLSEMEGGYYSRNSSPYGGKRTPIRSSGWETVASQLPIFTSTPLVPKATNMRELLEWEVSAVLDRTPPATTSPSDHSKSAGTPSGCSHKRHPNRRLLDTSNVKGDSPSSGFSSMVRSSQKSATSVFCTPLDPSPKDKIRRLKSGARHKAMVRKFTVPEKMLRKAKMVNAKRIRL